MEVTIDGVIQSIPESDTPLSLACAEFSQNSYIPFVFRPRTPIWVHVHPDLWTGGAFHSEIGMAQMSEVPSMPFQHHREHECAYRRQELPVAILVVYHQPDCTYKWSLSHTST